MEADPTYANYFFEKPQSNLYKTNSNNPPGRQVVHQEVRGFPQIDMLEQLVAKKENIVQRLDRNEDIIEEKIADLSQKKKSIRDEQNKLLKELEDLGLKLKDCDQNESGMNFRNCTVLSPYLVKYCHQILNKLKGVSENVSNAETKNEIHRAVMSIEHNKEVMDELIIKLLSCNLEGTSKKEVSLSEEREAMMNEREEVYSRRENICKLLRKLEKEIEEEKSYEEKYNSLVNLKNTAIKEAADASSSLSQVLSEKNELEIKLNDIHVNISKKTIEKNAANKEFSAFLDQYHSDFTSGLTEDLKEACRIMPDRVDMLRKLYVSLQSIEISKQIDYSISKESEMVETQDIYTGVLQVIGRVLCMIGKNNVDTAVANCRKDLEEKEPSSGHIKNIIDKCIEILNNFDEFISCKFEEGENLSKFESIQELLKCYISSQLKNASIFYELNCRKAQLLEQMKSQMLAGSEIEQKILSLNRKKTDLVNKLPNIKSQNKTISQQFNTLLQEQEDKIAIGMFEQEETEEKKNPSKNIYDMNETLDMILQEGMSSLPLDQNSMMESMDMQEGITSDSQCEDMITSQLSKDPARLIQIKENKKREAQENLNSLDDRLKKTEAGLKQAEEKMESNIREREYITEKIKNLRRGLVEALGKQSKEFQCISSLFDYMSKPVLSRDIGVSVMDSLLTDLSSLVHQINSEVSRQKRIIKLVSKHEDYSHEGR